MTRRKAAPTQQRALRPEEWSERDIRRLAASVLVAAVQDILDGERIAFVADTDKRRPIGYVQRKMARNFESAAGWIRESSPVPFGFETVCGILAIQPRAFLSALLSQVEQDRQVWLAGVFGL